MGRWKDEFLKPQPSLTEEELEACAQANADLEEVLKHCDREAAEAVGEAWDALDSDHGEHHPHDPEQEHGGEG
jgi:hypothetical protein